MLLRRRRPEQDLLDPDAAVAGVERGLAELVRPVPRMGGQRRVGRRGPADLDPQRQQAVVARGEERGQAVAEPGHDLVAVAGPAGVEPAGLPPHHVEPAGLGRDHLVMVVDRHQDASLGPGLAGMPALEVPREDDPGVVPVQRISRRWMCPSAQ